MVATPAAYIVTTIAFIGLLVFTVTVGNLFMAAQEIPAAYRELGSVSYMVQQGMLAAYRAAAY